MKMEKKKNEYERADRRKGFLFMNLTLIRHLRPLRDCRKSSGQYSHFTAIGNSKQKPHNCRNQALSVPHLIKLLILPHALQDLLSPDPRVMQSVDLGVMNPQPPFLPLPW